MRESISKLETVTTVGLDLAKNVFRVHAIDGQGNVVVDKALGRAKLLAFFAALPKCLVGMEACASAHRRPVRALGCHRLRRRRPAVSARRAPSSRWSKDAEPGSALASSRGSRGPDR